MHLFSVALLVAVVLLANAERVTSFQLTAKRSLVSLQNDNSPHRLLRRFDEERAVGAVAELATKLKDGASKLADKLVKSKKYEAQVAAQLKTTRIVDTADLVQVLKQVEQVNDKNIFNKVSVIGTLTTRYGDDALAKALLTAEKEAPNAKFASQIQMVRKEQLTRWRRGGNSADDVFKLLKIKGDDYSMVMSRKLDVLEDYVKLINTKKKKTDQVSLLSTLIKGFGGEAKLGALLQTSKTHSRTKIKAKEMEASLLRKWAGESQSPTNVFHWLKLYDNVDTAFTADNLVRFAKYVDDFSLKEPKYAKSVLEIYGSRFQDADLAIKLVAALDDPATRAVAQKLQTPGWRSVDDIVAKLNIQKNQDAELTSQKLDALVKFIGLKGGERNLISTLNQTFGSRRELASILNSASTTAEATTLQRKQFSTWIAKDISPENVMTRIFKKGANAASDEEKMIVAKFKAFYRSQLRG
ncbi:hypothetical protein GN958_ATG05683 [Phytophthora infestans]|uniref:Secreted RxLR effector peptide protein n=1 Tax=Phytophthora infestans TaxID=4787 RepID=A0A8S9TYG5_PHYIN|nr:hypothetical protein GN958_ATG18758 [Phytophthora infestans]KAF4145100.1 hypothetical protein GN958_ATG05683 [Phytophthora infestans]